MVFLVDIDRRHRTVNNDRILIVGWNRIEQTTNERVHTKGGYKNTMVVSNSTRA